MKDIRENNRFKQQYFLGEMLRFIDADKDKDGRLNMDEYFNFWENTYQYFKSIMGTYMQKSDEEIKSDYKMLCDMAGCDDGPNYQSLQKCNNIIIVGTAHLEIQE